MKHLVAALVLIVLARLPAGAADDARAVDTAHSRATFTVAHVLITRVTGTVPIVSGTVTVGADGITPVAASAILDPRRIDTGDADRDGDLQGPDWFDTKRFPTWTFTSTSVTPAAGGAVAVAGILTAHGIAVPIVLTTTMVRQGTHHGYHAVGHVDRHAFGMAVTRTDGLVGGDVTIALDVQLK